MKGGALNYRGLTLKQAYLASYFFNPQSETFGIIAKSARKAGYKGNPRTLAVVGFQTLRSPNMVREVRRRMKTVLSSEETLQEITGIAQQEVTDYKPSDKLKALELLAKFHKLLTDKVETTDTSERDASESAILKSIERTAEKVGITQESSAIELYLAGKDDEDSPLRDLANFGKFRSVIEEYLSKSAEVPENPSDSVSLDLRNTAIFRHRQALA